MSIEGFTITAGGEDIATEQAAALQSGALPNIIAHRISQIAKGHSQEADDAVTYAEMLAKVGPHFLQPMRDRTHGNASPAELRAAARAAEKLAALCWAYADKISRDPRLQQED